MPYRYVLDRQDYTDYSGGRVFSTRPGFPAFPVRLASEVFQRCLALREKAGRSGACLLYDPCCGGATHLAALALLHREALAGIAASDIDPAALRLARQNLSLLTLEGLDLRIRQIEGYLAEFGKLSHAAALESARRLRGRLESLAGLPPLEVHLFLADATRPEELRAGLGSRRADILLADVPYGRLSAWRGGAPEEARLPPAGQMLETLQGVLAPGAVLAVAADKDQPIAHPAYRQVGKMPHGRRQVVFLSPQR
jgi:tRNA G10  N-methylase Trm11